MLSRKNQVKEKVYRVMIYPQPYQMMFEAVDKITAKQKAVGHLSIRARDIYKITASTQAERALRGSECVYERLSTRRLIDEGYL